MTETNRDNEKVLVQMAQEGHREAFGKIVEIYQSRIRSYIARFVDGPDNVFDVAQNTFMAALKDIQRFDREKEFGPWLRGICRNRIYEFWRSRKQWRSVGLSLVDAAIEAQMTDTEYDLDETSEKVSALRRCIQKLNEEKVLDHLLLLF